MPLQFQQEIEQLIRARYSLLYVVTWEEERARRILMQVATDMRKLLFEWSITDGLRCMSGPTQTSPTGKRSREPLAVLNEILQADVSAIYILKDFHTYLETPEIVRQVRDLATALRRSKKTIVILSPVLTVPPELEKSASILDLPLPSYEDLAELLTNSIGPDGSTRKFEVRLTPADRDALIRAAQGLTLSEAENAYARAIVRDNVLDGQDVSAIAAEKKQVLRKAGLLEFYDVPPDLATVGGMDILKDWLRKRVRGFTEDARRYGLPQPKGILLMGVQGCGKSLVAKTIAAAWRLPLLRMDMSLIFQGFIGSSEQNMRKALKIAEGLAPVVLWIDEIEKALSGVGGSGNSDSGTTARVVGLFLTWLQEKTAPVFVVATANDVQGMPPELLRKGRLDDIFFVDLPHVRERAEIFQIHLRRVGRDPARFDCNTLAEAADGFSGAEIEQSIVSAMHDSFFAGREVETADILACIRQSVPLSRTMRERIEHLRAWSSDRARAVSSFQRPPNLEAANGPL